jgi:hypothetical protein
MTLIEYAGYVQYLKWGEIPWRLMLTLAGLTWLSFILRAIIIRFIE